MTVWRRIKDLGQRILHLGDSPRRTALAFSVGVFIAFSPTYGLHTVSVIFLAWALRLNMLAMFAGALVNNPWTILPIFGSSMWLGLALVPIGHPPEIDWRHFTLRLFWEQFQPYVVPFALGSMVMGFMAAVLAYPLVYIAIRRYRERQTQSTAPRG
jgi:uncharacterized protein